MFVFDFEQKSTFKAIVFISVNMTTSSHKEHLSWFEAQAKCREEDGLLQLQERIYSDHTASLEMNDTTIWTGNYYHRWIQPRGSHTYYHQMYFIHLPLTTVSYA